MIAVFVAMESELAGLARRLSARERETISGRGVVRGRCGGADVLVCRTGIGERVEGAMRAVLERYEASCVLSAGLAGALDPDLRAGDLLLCEMVVSGSYPQAPAVLPDARLLEAAASAAARAGPPVRRGGPPAPGGGLGDRGGDGRGPSGEGRAAPLHRRGRRRDGEPPGRARGAGAGSAVPCGARRPRRGRRSAARTAGRRRTGRDRADVGGPAVSGRASAAPAAPSPACGVPAP